MREEELTDQFIKLMDKIDLNETGVQIKFEDELKRYNRFHKGVLDIKGKGAEHQDINLRDYAKYVLHDGSNEEKRELMGCFKSKVILTQRAVAISTH